MSTIYCAKVRTVIRQTFSPIVILSKCSLWDDGETFSVEQKKDFLSNYQKLFPFVQASGRVADKHMNALWPFLPPVVKQMHALEDLAVNRDRTAVVSHPGYFTGRAEASVAAHNDDPSLRRPAKRKKTQAAVQWLEFPADAFAQNCSIAFIKGQLNVRGIKLGRTKSKENLLEMWKVASAVRPVPAYAAQQLAPSAPAVASGGGAAATVAPLAAAVGGAASAATVAPSAAAVGDASAAATVPDPAPPVVRTASKPRKCSTCHRAGHQKNNCPALGRGAGFFDASEFEIESPSAGAARASPAARLSSPPPCARGGASQRADISSPVLRARAAMQETDEPQRAQKHQRET